MVNTIANDFNGAINGLHRFIVQKGRHFIVCGPQRQVVTAQSRLPLFKFPSQQRDCRFIGAQQLLADVIDDCGKDIVLVFCQVLKQFQDIDFQDNTHAPLKVQSQLDPFETVLAECRFVLFNEFETIFCSHGAKLFMQTVVLVRRVQEIQRQQHGRHDNEYLVTVLSHYRPPKSNFWEFIRDEGKELVAFRT